MLMAMTLSTVIF